MSAAADATTTGVLCRLKTPPRLPSSRPCRCAPPHATIVAAVSIGGHMMVRSAALSALFLLFLPTRVLPAASVAPMLEMSADGEIQIAIDGRVSAYRLTSTLAPKIAALVDKN